MTEIFCNYYTHQGRFNLCSDEEQIQVVLQLKVGDQRKTISETWALDDDPEVSGLPPSEVLDAIQERLNKYWLNTRREESQKTIDWMRGYLVPMDHAWAKAQIELRQNQIAALEHYVLTDEELEDCLLPQD